MSNSDLALFNILETFLESSSSSSEEEEIITTLRTRRIIPKTVNYVECVKKMDNDTFCRHFRMCPETCEQLIDGFQQSDFFPKNEMHGGRSAVSAEKHILSFLWFAGNKSSMRDVADRFDTAISTCETILSRVMNYLLSIAKDVIKFLNNDEEKDELAYRFSKRFSKCIRMYNIDGSYI
ncbi:uncharacterized protein LOC143904307 [Temnothorax americanus]|uniref:uncharacterized protein LOC143904307 n=1 Tax=Temnothorax americanus TaxID=1964332 RepID=UPI004068142C